MALKIAINGYGRIGRGILRSLLEKRDQEVEIVAINSLCGLEHAAYCTKYDSIHGRFSGDIATSTEEEKSYLIVNQHKIQVTSEKDPAKLPWKALGVDIVMECTGAFRSKEKCSAHFQAGASKVILSCPADNNDCDATIVVGVNEHILSPNMTVISNASCTTNALAPIADLLHKHIGIECGLMTTIHSYTNDQILIDGDHKDFYRSRAAALNMIPTKTGAAQSVGIVIPDLAGRLSGYAVRVPTANVSLLDFTFTPSRETTKEEINKIIKNASMSSHRNFIGYNAEPLVSSDFNHTDVSVNYDEKQTLIVGNLVKIAGWYDNEWGFSNRMLDLAKIVGRL